MGMIDENKFLFQFKKNVNYDQLETQIVDQFSF